MNDFIFVSPTTLEEASYILAEKKGRIIAGGTDVIPQMLAGRLCPDWLIDLGRIENLSFIQNCNGWVEIGALTTYSQILESTIIKEHASLLAQAASLVGSIQIRNRGTIGGNIGNASPAGDTLPPLLTLNAEVVLFSRQGTRTVPLTEVLVGPGKTALLNDEIIQSIRFRPLAQGTQSIFLKLGSREGMAISIASVALVLHLNREGIIEDIRIALGAVAPTAIRCHEAEQMLLGKPLTRETIEMAGDSAGRTCSPITDIRGTAAYRRHAVKTMVKRGLQTFLNESQDK